MTHRVHTETLSGSLEALAAKGIIMIPHLHSSMDITPVEFFLYQE
jgi:hypothetical protein